MPRPTQYKITLDMGGKKYDTKGKTIFDALSDIPLKWNQIKAKGIITISKGDLSYEKMFFIRQLRGILMNKVNRQMWAKRLEFLLGG